MVTECVTGRPCFLVEHWLFIQLAARRRGQYASRLGGSAERAHGTPGWMSTLLGPEEAAASLRATTSANSLILPLPIGVTSPNGCKIRVFDTAARRKSSDEGLRRMVPSVS